MNIWQFLLQAWEWIFLFIVCFGGGIAAFIDRQLSLNRKHQEKMAEIKNQSLRQLPKG